AGARAARFRLVPDRPAEGPNDVILYWRACPRGVGHESGPGERATTARPSHRAVATGSGGHRTDQPWTRPKCSRRAARDGSDAGEAVGAKWESAHRHALAAARLRSDVASRSQEPSVRSQEPSFGRRAVGPRRTQAARRLRRGVTLL